MFTQYLNSRMKQNNIMLWPIVLTFKYSKRPICSNIHQSTHTSLSLFLSIYAAQTSTHTQHRDNQKAIVMFHVVRLLTFKQTFTFCLNLCHLIIEPTTTENIILMGALFSRQTNTIRYNHVNAHTHTGTQAHNDPCALFCCCFVLVFLSSCLCVRWIFFLPLIGNLCKCLDAHKILL